MSRLVAVVVREETTRSAGSSSRQGPMAEVTWAAEEEGPWEEDQGKEGIEMKSRRQKALCCCCCCGLLVCWFVGLFIYGMVE